MSYIKRKAEKQRKGNLSAQLNHAHWIPLRIDFMQSQARQNLSAFGSKLLFDILSMYNGFNNGDLACAYDGIMKAKGWKSETTLRKAVKELLAANIIVLTRQGGRNKTPNLYALTCFKIDECKGKLHCQPTSKAPDSWKQ